jgi:transposase
MGSGDDPNSVGGPRGIATGHTDMRRGMNSLALLVQEAFKRDPHGGDLYVFRGKSGKLGKILWHDRLGMSLYAKRLERGRFIWTSVTDGVVSISMSQLAYMLDGIDWRNPSTRGVPGRPDERCIKLRLIDSGRAIYRTNLRDCAGVASMVESSDHLPEDTAALKAALIETRSKLSGAEALIEHLQLVIAAMKREMFGPLRWSCCKRVSIAPSSRCGSVTSRWKRRRPTCMPISHSTKQPLAKLKPYERGKRTRFQPTDRLLAFLEAL